MSSASSANNTPGSIEVIFLGTGTSSSIPHVDCLTRPPNAKQCRTCLSTLTPEGKHNIRRNTSAVVRLDGKDGKRKTIVIDVGKNFQAAAIEWFPKFGLRHIDAVLITHAHADAMNGLDDLRGWTLGASIQPHIDLYVSQTTFTEIKRAFPYLVSKEFASGGGDIPEFKWHIIADKVPFEIADTGIEVTPFAVQHGRYFTPPSGHSPTPNATIPSTPDSTTPSPPSFQDLKFPTTTLETIYPYLCLAFKIQKSILYLSDVSYIPDDAWRIIEEDKISVCALDCLKLVPHTSHFGLAQAVAATRRIAAQKTYFLGFGHEATHDELVTLGRWLDPIQRKPKEELTTLEKRGVEMIEDGEVVWIRPAHDGLRVTVSKDEESTVVQDDTYDS